MDVSWKDKLTQGISEGLDEIVTELSAPSFPASLTAFVGSVNRDWFCGAAPRTLLLAKARTTPDGIHDIKLQLVWRRGDAFSEIIDGMPFDELPLGVDPKDYARW